MKIQLNIGSLHRPLLADATITAGILCWDSNGRVPPAEVVQAAVAAGHPVDPAACALVRDTELRAFLAAYRAADPKPDAEQLAEMRAEFGPGAEVVNVISGRVTRL